MPQNENKNRIISLESPLPNSNPFNQNQFNFRTSSRKNKSKHPQKNLIFKNKLKCLTSRNLQSSYSRNNQRISYPMVNNGLSKRKLVLSQYNKLSTMRSKRNN